MTQITTNGVQVQQDQPDMLSYPPKQSVNTQQDLGRINGLGMFSVMDDHLLLDFLRYCDESTLLKISLLSKWKRLCIKKFVKDKVGHFTFKGSWKRTTLLPRDKTSKKPYPQITITNFSSQLLYAKWYRAHVPLSNFNITFSHVDRRSNLSLEEFIEEYEKPNKPVIITDVVTKWPAMQNWTKEALKKRYGNTFFKTNGTDSKGHSFRLTFNDYAAYMEENHDEKPIYLFDNKFHERAPGMLEDYEVPVYFQEDLFAYMSEEDRPDYRWIIIGPSRSGSPLHQDPHRTSAWNALLLGRKRWTLYPPDVIPPGVDEDLIDSEYYASPEVMKWFVETYPFIKDKPDQKPMECILEAGEVIFVPSGWWHQVLNLEDTIAVTQNFCSPRILKVCYEDMVRRKSRSLRRDFDAALLKHRPDLKKEVEGYGAIESSSSSSCSSSSSDSD